MRWMPGGRPRTAAWQCGGKLESRHRAGLPGPRAELAGLLAEAADADGAAVGAVRRGSCRFRPWLAGLKRDLVFCVAADMERMAVTFAWAPG